MNRFHVLLSALVLGCGPTDPGARADAGAGRACVYGEMWQAIEVSSTPGAPPHPGLCLSRPGIRATDCVVTEHDPSGTCAARAGREAVPGDPTRCRVLPGADGFWIENDPDACGENSSDDAPAMRFAQLAPSVLIHTACRLPDEEECGALQGPTLDPDPAEWGRVGSACALPHDVCYDDREVYVEPRSAACGGLPCMAYGLLGCGDELGVESQVFCTCRCSSLAGDPSVPLCRCPSGTQCVDEVLSAEGTSLRGGYCLPCVTPDDERILSPVFPRCDE